MCALRMPRKSCSCLSRESIAGRIDIVGGDTAGTGRQIDMTEVHNCRIYFKKSDVLNLNFIIALTL